MNVWTEYSHSVKLLFSSHVENTTVPHCVASSLLSTAADLTVVLCVLKRSNLVEYDSHKTFEVFVAL